MKCFTWEYGQLTPGIQVEKDGALGTVVALGEDGRGGGRYHEKVELFRKNPPDIKDGAIFDAHPVKITTDLEQDRHYYLLAKPEEEDHRSLVRIITRWTYACRTHGRWKSIKGNPEDLVVGCGAHGIVIRRNATWYDGLVLFSPGDAVCVKPEGAHEIERYALFYDEENGMQSEFFSAYRNRFASVIQKEFI